MNRPSHHHGKPRAVLLSVEQYAALAALRPDFRSDLLGGPKVDAFPRERDSDTGRDAGL